MSKTTKIDQEYEEFEELFNNLNIWENPNEVEESSARKYLESKIIQFVFGDKSDVHYGQRVNKSDLEPKFFQSTEKIEVEKVDDEEYEDAYKIDAKISTLSVDTPVSVYFDGYVTKDNGLIEARPTQIRY